MNDLRRLTGGLCIACMLFCVHSSQAQKGYEIGGWIGPAYYFGDLRTSFALSRPDIAGGLIFRYNFDSRVSLKASVNYLRLSAADSESNNAFEQARNLSFYTHTWDLTGQIEFNFLPYIHGHDQDWYTPYVFIGPSVYRFNPRADLNGTSYALVDLGTEGQLPGEEYSTMQLSIAYGLGYKFDISSSWSVNVELSNRYLFTDYLDDVSGSYPDPDELESLRGPIAAQLSDRSIEELNVFGLGEAGRQRGNSRKNDSYHYLSVGLVYYIGWLECPQISRF